MKSNLILSFTIACALTAQSAPTFADDRAQSLINSFQILCMLELPSFARQEQKAETMKLLLRKDIGQPRNDGNFAHSKSWNVNLKTGPHELVATEARGPKGDVSACGIGAADAEGAIVKSELIHALRLDTPLSTKISDNGQQQLTTWKIKSGSTDVTISFVDGEPGHIPGFYLTASYKTPSP